MVQIINQKEIALDWSKLTGAGLGLLMVVIIPIYALLTMDEPNSVIGALWGMILICPAFWSIVCLLLTAGNLISGELTLQKIEDMLFKFCYKEVKQSDKPVTTYHRLTDYKERKVE